MKYIACSILLLIIASTAYAQTSTFPKPIGFVNDFEGDFTRDEVKVLEDMVKGILSRTMELESLNGVELVVVTVTDSMYGDEKEMSAYATKLGEKWAVGTRGINKAIILAYSKKIRKVAIVTGAGLDRYMSAETIRRIIDEQMAMEFRRSRYFDALCAGLNGISQALGFPPVK